MKNERSAALWQEANKFLVGGVNSPVRAFNAVGGVSIPRLPTGNDSRKQYEGVAF